MTCLLSTCRIICTRIAPDAPDEATRLCALELAGVLATLGVQQPPEQRELVRQRNRRRRAA